MMLLIDNYDSFSYNLVQMAGGIEPDIKVVRNDAVTVEEVFEMKPTHIILSPGPGYPKDAGLCEELVKKADGRIPILGVCLGHQGICEAFGAKITHARYLMHGKQSRIQIHNENPIFKGLGAEEDVARYHSLVAAPETMPGISYFRASISSGVDFNAKWTENDGKFFRLIDVYDRRL